MPSMFEEDPRTFAMELVAQGHSADNLLLCCLKYMSHDDVRDMLDCNELSPRFDEDHDEEEGFKCPDCGGPVTEQAVGINGRESWTCDVPGETCDPFYYRSELT